MKQDAAPQQVTLIKFGGSLITEKSRPMTARQDIITALASQIAAGLAARPSLRLVLGNGAGSFGHYQVVSHGLEHGISRPEQRIGFAEVHDAVATLNRLVVRSLLDAGVPAVSVAPSALMVAGPSHISARFDVIPALLRSGQVPVVYGDIITDSEKGCRIVSTEQVFEAMIGHLSSADLCFQRVIQLGRIAGVLDTHGSVIPEITPQNWNSVLPHLTGVEGFDVTGGMQHKIETALSYAKQGIETIITCGEAPILLPDLISGRRRTGTVIHS